MGKISRLAIANRGEIAVRIIQTCEEMGIECVLLHSDVDVGSRAYRMAHHRVELGPAPADQSYLNMGRVIEAALSSGAQALHPGVGFLSESGVFAEACQMSGLIFVGSSASVMHQLGDKVRCRSLAKSLGIPVLPSQDFVSPDEIAISLPYIIKYSQGGGGRGLRLIRSIEDFLPHWTRGRDGSHPPEAKRDPLQKTFDTPGNSFDETGGGGKEGSFYVEKYLDRARHIEIQIFGDGRGRVWNLGSRECTLQRRHQKIIEEAPFAAPIPKELLREMGKAALCLAQHVNYGGAGTVEFLLQDEEFYLLEVNTRLQVEHTLTEALLPGLDLVRAQIRVASDEEDGHLEGLVKMEGGESSGVDSLHAMECRVCAERPYEGGVPALGTLGPLYWPLGPGRRFDVGFEEGDEITPHYDSLLAKVVVWGPSRQEVLERMKVTLEQTIIFGIDTNIPLLLELLEDQDVRRGQITTEFIENKVLPTLSKPRLSPSEEVAVQEMIRRMKQSGMGEFSLRGGEGWSQISPQGESTQTSPFGSHWRVV